MAGKKKKIHFPVTGSLLHCPACKKRILVQRVLMGIDHDLQVAASCWECLSKEVQEKVKKRYILEMMKRYSKLDRLYPDVWRKLKKERAAREK